ncbi:hypothetical protein OAN12_00275 [Halioglobus sp.]|nr:hypothetical protein [Halioglobus sp.]
MESFKRDFIKRFDNELKSLPRTIHTVIISSEHFHSRLREEGEMQKLKTLLSQYFDEVRIFCYLREQADTCESWYSTSMKSGATYSFHEFLRRCKPQTYYFNYYEVLKNWAKFFGREAVHAAVFDRRYFLDENLLADFTFRIDPELVAKLDTAVRSVNESLMPMGQALSRALNMQFPVDEIDDYDKKVLQACRNVIAKEMSGKGQQMTFERREAIYASFSESNEKIRCEYFPTRDVLFSPPKRSGEAVAPVDRKLLPVLNSFFKVLDADKKRQLSAADYQDLWRAIVVSVRDVVDIEEEVLRGGVEVVMSEDDGRLLRRAAMLVEWSDTSTALRLMTLAHAVSPDLLGIQAKLKSYREKQLEEQEQGGPVDHAFIILFRASRDQNVSRDINPETSQRLSEWIRSLNVPSGTHRVLPLSEIMTSGSCGRVEEDNESVVQSYSLFKARSTQEAVAIAETCPHLEGGGSVELFKVEKF